MKKLHLALILPFALLSLSAASADEAALQPQNQGDVMFVSGGVGSDEQQALLNVRSHYNLHLLFSVQGTGEYLSDVPVHITDSRGGTVLDTVSDGPKLFARLSPGRYTITAGQNGRELRKTANIRNGQSVSLSFAWPGE